MFINQTHQSNLTLEVYFFVFLYLSEQETFVPSPTFAVSTLENIKIPSELKYININEGSLI